MTPLARCGDREPLDLALGERQRQADRQHGVDGPDDDHAAAKRSLTAVARRSIIGL
jgi:hypothetical protein